jgi:hypothetical protein
LLFLLSRAVGFRRFVAHDAKGSSCNPRSQRGVGRPKLLLGAGRGLICSLRTFSLAKEDQVNDNAYQYYGHDNQLLQVFRIKGPRWNCPRCSSTMTAMMIEDGKRVAAGGARLQWHMVPIADIDLIARNTAGGETWIASSLRGRRKVESLRR